MIGKRAQDSIVGRILKESESRASVLRKLECLIDEDVLTERQTRRYLRKIEKIDASKLYASGIGIDLSFNRVISALQSHDWYKQNPAIDYIVSSGFKTIGDLSKEDQILLGRNVLQAAEGSARSAVTLLDLLTPQ